MKSKNQSWIVALKIMICLIFLGIVLMQSDVRNFVVGWLDWLTWGDEKDEKAKPPDPNAKYIGSCEPPLYVTEDAGGRKKLVKDATSDDLESFSSVRSDYHSYINCLFNNAVEKLEATAEKTEEKHLKLGCMQRGLYSTILNATKIIERDPASGKRIGLAEVIIEEYKLYMNYLDELEKTMKTEFGESESVIETFSWKQRALLQRAGKIEEERDIAKESFDIALYIFDEMRVAYPLHVQLMCLAKNLETERYTLGDLRTYVQCFPAKFVNASTSAHSK